MKKKLLAILLSAAMIFSSLSVYAETDLGNETESMSAVETDPEQGENIADSEEAENEDTEENIKENPDLSMQPDTFVSDEAVEATEEIIDISESAAEASFTSVDTDSFTNYIGEIQVGDTVEKDNVEAGEEYQLIFKVPATGKYRIYLLENYYDDSLIVTNEQNEVIAPCDEEGYQLTAGQTVVIRVVCDDDSYYRWAPLKVRLIDYVNIEDVTCELPQYIPNYMARYFDLNIHYSNGETREVEFDKFDYSYVHADPILNQKIDIKVENDGTVVCTVEKFGTYQLGKMNFLNWGDPAICNISGEGDFTYTKEDLLSGKFISLNPVQTDPNRKRSGIYTITVNGNVSNDFQIWGYDGEKGGDYYSEETEEGIVISHMLYSSGVNMLYLNDHTQNTSYTFHVRKTLEPVSVTINLLDDEFRTIEDIKAEDVTVRAEIIITYEDGSSENKVVDCKYWDHQYIPLKPGYDLNVWVGKGHGLDTGCYVLEVSCLDVVEKKYFVVYPKSNFREEYDSFINLTANSRSINVPALGDSDTRIVKIYSQTDCNYLLETSQDMHISVFEEANNKLIPCYTKIAFSEDSNRIHFENGKTYYLVCTESDSTDKKKTTVINLNGYYSRMEVINLPDSIETMRDLENGEVIVFHTVDGKTRFPLVVNGELNEDELSFGVQQYDPSQDRWFYPGIFGWPGARISVDDLLNYLKTGELRGFVAGKQYGILIGSHSLETHIPFVPKGDGRIVTQPENVTASINNKISFSVNAENAASYQWQYSKDGGTSWSNSTVASAKTDTLELTVSKTNYQNIYRCKVTGKKGAIEYSDSAAIDLIPWSEITVQPESPAMINGETVKFHCEATNAASYQWQYSKDGTTWKNSTLSSAKTDTLSIKVSDTNSMNIYRCQVTGIDGNKVNSSKAVFVLLTQQPEPCSAPIGTKAAYTIKAENAASYQWQYSKDGGVTWSNSTLTSAKTDTLTFTVAASNQANLYRCKMKTTTGVYAYTKPVGYVDELKIASQPSDITVEGGASASFKVAATGKDLTYQWQYSKDNGKTWINSTVASAKTATLKVTIQASYDGRLYRCVIKDGSGKTVNSNGAKVTIAGAGPVIKTQPADAAAAEGKAVYFKVEADGENLTYQWQFSKDNGATWTKSTLSTATTASLKVTAQASQNGRLFRCVITDGYGKKVTSAAAKLTVK